MMSPGGYDGDVCYAMESNTHFCMSCMITHCLLWRLSYRLGSWLIYLNLKLLLVDLRDSRFGMHPMFDGMGTVRHLRGTPVMSVEGAW